MVLQLLRLPHQRVAGPNPFKASNRDVAHRQFDFLRGLNANLPVSRRCRSAFFSFIDIDQVLDAIKV